MNHSEIKLFMEVEDVQRHHNRSLSWAYARLKKIHAYFKLLRHERVNIYQFCEYEKIPIKQFIKRLLAAAANRPADNAAEKPKPKQQPEEQAG